MFAPRGSSPKSGSVTPSRHLGAQARGDSAAAMNRRRASPSLNRTGSAQQRVPDDSYRSKGETETKFGTRKSRGEVAAEMVQSLAAPPWFINSSQQHLSNVEEQRRQQAQVHKSRHLYHSHGDLASPREDSPQHEFLQNRNSNDIERNRRKSSQDRVYSRQSYGNFREGTQPLLDKREETVRETAITIQALQQEIEKMTQLLSQKSATLHQAQEEARMLAASLQQERRLKDTAVSSARREVFEEVERILKQDGARGLERKLTEERLNHGLFVPIPHTPPPSHLQANNNTHHQLVAADQHRSVATSAFAQGPILQNNPQLREEYQKRMQEALHSTLSQK